MKILLRTTIGLLLGASVAVPAYADSVTCADGTSSAGGRGACSHHGGIAKDEPRTPDAKKPDVDKDDRTDAAPTRTRAHSKPAPIDRNAERREADRAAAERSERAATPAADREGAPRTPRSDDTGAPTARCKDGHFSHSTHHSGTCSGHGGVAEWLVD